MTKQCYECGGFFELSGFYKNKSMSDGHVNKCKECTKKYQHKLYEENFEHYRAYDKARFQTSRRKAQALIYQKERRSRSPEKAKARNAVSNAIRDKRLTRLPCVKCGEPKSQAHHHDYSKPLDVTWLCFKCHRLEHGQINVLR